MKRCGNDNRIGLKCDIALVQSTLLGGLLSNLLLVLGMVFIG